MNMDLSDSPVFDREESLKLAGNRADLAQEILGLLVKRLPEDLSIIKQLNTQGDRGALRNEVHKLHGAVCYCGTPRLKSVLAKLESDLKNNILVDLPRLIDQLQAEVSLVLAHHASEQSTAVSTQK